MPNSKQAVQWFNSHPEELLLIDLERCCGAHRWVTQMLAARPFKDTSAIFSTADTVWFGLSAEDWQEAFSHHPKIGDIQQLKTKFATTANWSGQEQAGVTQASDEVLTALFQGNQDYEAKFGYIFIVCATGKTAAEMLGLLQARLQNEPSDEIQIAAHELAKIMTFRLEKLLREAKVPVSEKLSN